MHRIEEVVAPSARCELLIRTAGSTGGRHHAIVSYLDGFDLALLDPLSEIIQGDWLDVGSPTLLYDRKKERNDRDQDDEVNEAVSQPLSIHAWWDPPGCSHYTREASTSQVLEPESERARALPSRRRSKVSAPTHTSMPYGK